jgi:predicted phage-related endonuclease
LTSSGSRDLFTIIRLQTDCSVQLSKPKDSRKAVKSLVRMQTNVDRRGFIGGSDARIITGQDEKTLIRLWQEKRGEVGPEDLSANLIVQLGVVTEDLNRVWYERNTGHAITCVQSRVKHPVISWMAATLDGMVTETGDVQVHAAVVVLRRSGRREAHGPAPAQHVGD